MKAFVMQTEAVLSVFFAFLGVALLFSSAVQTSNGLSQRMTQAQKQSETDALAEFICVSLVDGEGNILLDAATRIAQNNTRITIGNQTFGARPLGNSSVFVSRRLVFALGSPTVLEVSKW